MDVKQVEHRRLEPSFAAVLWGEQSLRDQLSRPSPKKMFELHVPEYVRDVATGNSLCAGIEQHHPLLHVRRDDRINARVDQRFQELHRFEELPLGFA